VKSVGIFRTAFPLKSETFIREQAGFLPTWHPHIITRRRESDAGFELTALGDERTARLQQLLWTVTRAPVFFPLDELRKIKLIHAHFGFDAVMAQPLAERLGIPLIVTLHGCDATTDIKAFRRSSRLTEQWFSYKRPMLQKQAKAFIAVSRFIEQELLKTGYPRDKVIQHYVGVDTEKFKPVLKDASAKRYVLNVARHSEVKGVDDLVRAWALIASKHPDVEFWQVGDGELLASHQKLAADLGIADRVRFLGGLEHAKVLGLMQGAEIFSLSSYTTANGAREALGIVLNEASACGVPIVATRHGGIPEAVVHQETGLLCAERDVKNLAESIDALLADRALGRKFGERGREFVCEAFDLRKQCLALEKIYDGVIAK
jgi:colanic acid/amylovoran biosynthesis glycosyltransferase